MTAIYTVNQAGVPLSRFFPACISPVPLNECEKSLDQSYCSSSTHGARWLRPHISETLHVKSHQLFSAVTTVNFHSRLWLSLCLLHQFFHLKRFTNPSAVIVSVSIMPVTCGKMESFPNCVGDRIKSSISTRGQGHTRNSSHSRLTTTCIQLCTIHCERGAPKRIQ